MPDLNSLTHPEYQTLVRSGLFWELYPDATGNYAADVSANQKNPIRITVAGGVGVGKSVIIQLIKDALESVGFDVKSLDDEFDLTYKFDARVRLVAENTLVELAPLDVTSPGKGES